MTAVTATGERRVVVTGLGAVTPLGLDVPGTWDGFISGRSGVDRIRSFDPSRLTSQVAGEIPGFDPAVVLDRKEARRTDRYTQLAMAAAREAMDAAGLPPRLEGELAEETGVIVGSGLGGSGTLFEQIAVHATRGPDRLSPFFVPMAIANMASGQIAISFGPRGPNWATVSACATAGHAIGEAAETILRGDAEVMIAGGAEAPVVEGLVGAFAAMRALSTRNDDPAGATRPFDRGRDGFVIAEGAGTLVLEELGHARRRDAPIFAELVGYAATADASHVTLPPRDGNGGLRASRRALEKARISADAVDHVSAHATSTPEGDVAELAAIRQLLGERAPEVSINALKGAIGHTLGAAGAIASIVAILAMREGCIPPTLNLTDPDDAVGELDCTPLQPRARRADVAMVNAFGFGGQNSCVVYRRWTD